MKKLVTESGFAHGFAAALVERRICRLSGFHTVQFEQSIAAGFREFQQAAERLDCEVAFHIRLNPIHGRPDAARDIVTHLLSLNIAVADAQEYDILRLRIDESKAKEILEESGIANRYRVLAERFITHFIFNKPLPRTLLSPTY